MVVSMACRECEALNEQDNLVDGGCRPGCMRYWDGDPGDVELGNILEAFGFKAEEVTPPKPKTDGET